MIHTRTVLQVAAQRDGLAWSKWNGSIEELLREARETLWLETGLERPQASAFDVGAIAWVLDRLADVSALEEFRALRERADAQVAGIDDSEASYGYVSSPCFDWACLAFAWARRLGFERRHEIFSLPISRFIGAHQIAQAAWCEVCARDDPEELLRWWDQCRQHGHDVSGHGVVLVVREYSRRVRSRADRMRGLSRLVEVANRELAQGYVGSWETARSVALRALLRDTASEEPLDREIEIEQINEQWLVAELARSGSPEVGHLVEEALRTRGGHSAQSLSHAYWEYRHGAEAVDQLLIPYLTRRFLDSDRLTEIIPEDRNDLWAWLIHEYPGDRHWFSAYCNWVRPELRDLLTPYFADQLRNSYRAHYAFQSYVAKAPKTVLTALWDARSCRFGHHLLLDRVLFAPEAIRPHALVTSTLEIEDDVRGMDALLPTGFG